MNSPQKNDTSQHKPVIMLVVDTLMNPPLQEAIKQGRAPAFQFLIDKGMYFPDVVTAYPAMSVNVDTTLLSGGYCNEHGLPGLVWFSVEENRLINYGTGFREVMKLGLSRSLEDTLYNMNNKHISKNVKTIHEELGERGKGSASINALVFRGPSPHQYKLPRWLTALTSLPKNHHVKGTEIFTYGALKRNSSSKKHQSIWKNFGFNNAYAVEELIYLLKKEQPPAFTIVYLPELDKSVHKNGRMDVDGVVKADEYVREILDSFSSWDQALEDYILITIGDNGMAWIDADRNKALIDLQKIFASRKIMKLRKGVRSDTEIVLAVNQRMAYVYTLDENALPLNMLADELAHDSRIDVIAWKEGDIVKIRSGAKEGELRFRKAGDYIDPYNQSWSIDGNTEILDLTVEGKNISYGDYPDALARIFSSLGSHTGNFLIANARPGCEFIGESSPSHIGGASHGGLHKEDSLIPMIVNGTEKQPDYLRIVNLKEWLLRLIETSGKN